MNKPRILLVEDAPDQALLMGRWLLHHMDVDLKVACDGEGALALLHEMDFDLMLLDVELPDISGLEVAAQARLLRPFISVTMMTANPTVEYATRAIEHRVKSFLQKPLARDALIKSVRADLAHAKQTRALGQRRVLAIGAHPDDVEIGCGGTLAASVGRGDAVAILTLTGGEAGGEAQLRTLESKAAANLIGCDLYMESLCDTRLSPGFETITAIQRAIEIFRPDVVYTHSFNDTHQDHRAVHQATLVATRGISEVLCYQSPSSTIEFSPRQFQDISGSLKRKLEMIRCYETQTSKCDYLDPGLIRATARYWGRFSGTRYVEPFEVVRSGGNSVALADPGHHPSIGAM